MKRWLYRTFPFIRGVGTGRSWILGWFAVGIVGLVVVLVVDNAVAPPPSSSGSVQQEETPASDSSNEVTPEAPSVIGTPEFNFTEEELAPLKQSLNEAAAAFELAFHGFTHQDTADSRISRLSLLATDRFLAELHVNFMVEGSIHDVRFDSEQLTSSATTSAGDVTGKLYGPSEACADVWLAISTFRPDGTLDIQVETTVSRYYVIQDGKWMADGNVTPIGSTCPDYRG